MSPTNPTPDDHRDERPPAASGEPHTPRTPAYMELVESIASSLREFGGWIFGGLIGFYLLVLSAVLTVGPVDPAIIASTIAIAIGLPLTLAGLLILRLEQDWRRGRSEEEWTRTYQDAVSAVGEPVASPAALEAWRRRRAGSVLRSSLWILGLTCLLALICLSAVLWHMGWWIAVVFFAMVVISLGIVVAVLGDSPQRGAGEGPTRWKRYREALRQARKRPRINGASS